jgi:hypothetical protein
VINALTTLDGRWADWMVQSWDGFNFTLIADNDLTYHHEVAVRFADTRFVACPAEFSWPTFREPTAEESARVQQLHDPDEDIHVFSWDAESGNGRTACLVLAKSVTVAEELVLHYTPDGP